MKQSIVEPRIIIAPGITLKPNAKAIAKSMRKAGVTDKDIRNTTIMFENNKRFIMNGMHWPAWFAKRFFYVRPKYGKVEGDVLRITVNKVFGTRSKLSIAKSIVHQSVHAAQANRWSMLMWSGHGIILSSTILGVIFGYQLGPWSVALALIGGIDGYALGFQLAPHEHQARTVVSNMQDADLEKLLA